MISHTLVLRGYLIFNNFFYIQYIVSILHIERSFINHYHILTVCSLGYTVFVLKETFPERLFSMIIRNAHSLLTWRLPRFVTFTLPALISKALKCEFTRLLLDFLWRGKIVWSLGLKSIKKSTFWEMYRKLTVGYMPHKHNWSISGWRFSIAQS